jgi:hypothetical protein
VSGPASNVLNLVSPMGLTDNNILLNIVDGTSADDNWLAEQGKPLPFSQRDNQVTTIDSDLDAIRADILTESRRISVASFHNSLVAHGKPRRSIF